MASHSNPASPELPSIRDESGQVILRTALIATLYFENGLDLEVRWRIGECLDLYLAATGNELHWMTDPDAERWYRIDTSRLEAFKNWLRTGTPDYSWRLLSWGEEILMKPANSNSWCSPRRVGLVTYKSSFR